MEAASLVPAMLAVALCLAGDVLGTLPTVAGRMWLRVAVDNFTHGAVGAASWGAVVIGRLTVHSQILEIMLAGLLAMALDVDHFILAGSFELNAALSLPRRPPFHTTSLIPVITLVLWLLPQRLSSLSGLPPEMPWLFCVSWLSHHIRDGARRGLWFWPFGSTPTLPSWMYLGGIVALPLITRLLLVQLQVGQWVRRTVNYTMLHV